MLFKFSVDLEKGLKECREGIQRIQNLPEGGSVSTSDHGEHVKAVQQTLDEYRAQLGTHEKKLQDGERRKLVKASQQFRRDPQRFAICPQDMSVLTVISTSTISSEETNTLLILLVRSNLL